MVATNTNSSSQEERDHALALIFQRKENELAEHNVLEKEEKADNLRCGRSGATSHFVAAMHGHVEATTPHAHRHYKDTALEAQDIYKQEKKLRDEKAHRATRSAHGYL